MRSTRLSPAQIEEHLNELEPNSPRNFLPFVGFADPPSGLSWHLPLPLVNGHRINQYFLGSHTDVPRMDEIIRDVRRLR